ncbi:hypothetical protein [Mesorhizobium sp. J428]|uniref:hypothetical protein n=1 Tax=Mesorhizobium sp. J428 TaxID=2898440 RepID=UPI002151BF4E|nr:hypothetical protein [Mesorhizobium sp. J428]MCR5856587.1 hypothetical protein [Mesorhizobium sp. J428]
MRSTAFQMHLAELLDRQPGEVDQRCRKLRETGIVYAGGRGNSAPHLTIEEGASQILAMVSRRATDAYEVAARLIFDCALADPTDTMLHTMLFGYPNTADLLLCDSLPEITVGMLVAVLMNPLPSPGHVDINKKFFRLEIDHRGVRAKLNIMDRRLAENGEEGGSWGVDFVTPDLLTDFPINLNNVEAGSTSRPRTDFMEIGHKFVVTGDRLAHLGAMIKPDAPDRHGPLVRSVPGGGPLRLSKRATPADGGRDGE